MIKGKIIDYIQKNRVSTTEVADCLGKSGALDGILPLNLHHFAVGEIQYLYAIQDFNWTVHEGLDMEPVSNKIILIDAIDVHGRAVIGDIVSKYILLYLGNKAVVCTGKMRDAHILTKENYPIWCAGVSPVGCFNKPVEKEKFENEIQSKKEKYQGAVAVCDDSGVVIIPQECITEEFYKKLIAIEEQEDIWYDCIDRRKWSTYDTICLKKYLQEKEFKSFQ
ncbi:MAG: RraA family protein [Lachnospiraceae bacterium]|nr:RraA family protein [Lachnospiraceae bacterium]